MRMKKPQMPSAFAKSTFSRSLNAAYKKKCTQLTPRVIAKLMSPDDAGETSAAPDSSIARPQSKEEYDALLAGTRYVSPKDGTIRVKLSR
jgi:hypothetical protein